MRTSPYPHLEPDRLLSQPELAKRWQLSGRTLEKWRTLGLGPAYIRIGRRIRYPTRSVAEYEAEHMQGGR